MLRADLFRILGDKNRLRLLTLLAQEELSVTEMQEILGISQSTASGHLSQLRRSGLVVARREGAHARYALGVPPGEEELVTLAASTPLSPADRLALERVRAARQAPPADGLDPLPGRSWEALARLLLRLLPPLRIADLGVGTGHLTTLLAARAAHVIAIDHDPATLSRLSPPIETRLGTLEDPPLADGEVELVLLSQSLHFVRDPLPTLIHARRALVSGGRIAILDLAPHGQDWVLSRLGHFHLGFPDLPGLLVAAGFREVEEAVVHQDRKAPGFVTLLAVGTR